MKFFKRLFQARDKPKKTTNLFTGGGSFTFGLTTSGNRVNNQTAMRTTAVYACVRILSEAIASIPLNFYRYTPDGGKEKYPTHPLYYLLHDEPNPEMTSFVFRETLMGHLLLWGNAYAQIVRNGKGEVLALYPLLPDRMQVDRDSAGRLVYTYTRYRDESGSKRDFETIKRNFFFIVNAPFTINIKSLELNLDMRYAPYPWQINTLFIFYHRKER